MKFLKVSALLFLTLVVSTFAEETPTPATPAPSFPPQYISVKKLHADLAKGRHYTILDVRSAYAYQMEHIKNAQSLPIQEITYSSVLSTLPKIASIVTYCSCPHHLAEMAFQILKQKGYNSVWVLDEGIPGWKKENYPLEGTLANKPFTIYWVIGYIYGPSHVPKKEAEVRVYQEKTQQLEIDKADAKGFYAMPLRFYGLMPGDSLQASIGGDTVFFTVGAKTNPWGIRIDDEGSEISLKQNEFLKTFKSKKLHLN